ncbi:RDD family protein [Rossellomorea sp. SC111]|uniref:RDD family protein n=1 Tax=Rossellomorea sp. SC111 TaxID=2968985 RepID=UPI00215A4F38|nr:RDD family protein [Rossellomorea sp. SC111]MCR8848984.1 RDD family protein [Rossellomorea sp. SC111]
MINQPAGFWTRLGAGLANGLFINVPLLVLFGVVTDELNPDDPIISFIMFLYFLLTPVFWKGYDVGKKTMGIRIVKKDGSNIHIGNMLMRNVVTGVFYLITFGFGALLSAFFVIFRDDKRAIHDFVAGTYVTKMTPEESLKQVTM